MAAYVYPGYAFDRGGERVVFGIAHESVGGGGADNWSARQWVDYFAANAKTKNPGSYHHLIMPNGFILGIVPETMAAASTGYGVVPGWNSWNPNATPEPRPDRNLNKGSVNVCLATPIDMPADWKYPADQIDMLDKLCREIQGRYPGIRWFTHNECDAAAVAQGMDPGQAHHDPRNFDANAWRARLKGTAPVPVPPPALVEIARHAAWDAEGVPYNPGSAFSVYSRLKGYGAPLTKEFDFAHGGLAYRGQGYTGKIVYCEVGKWNDLHEGDW